MKQLRNLSICLLSLAYLFTMNSCKKNSDSTLQLPPSSSMSMDFGFTTMTKSASESQTQVYHTLAAGAVLTWSAVAYNLTNIPSAAFKKAMENTPVYNDVDKVWEWSYVTTFGEDSYNSKLTGKLSEDSVQWKMYLSKVGDDNLQNYLWFEGKSHQARTGGWWILNYPQTSGADLISTPGLKITWSYTNDNLLSIKYLNVVENEDKGGYIEYGRKSNGSFDSYYTISSEKDRKKYDILWNIGTKAGQIKLNDIAFGCWDTNKEDITCTN